MGDAAFRIETCWAGAGILLDPESLEQAAAAWDAKPWARKDPFWNRQFLALLAIHLVQHFKAEEHQRSKTRAVGRDLRRLENQRLALRLRDMMAEAERGQDVTAGIRGILAAWRRQQACTFTQVTAGFGGH